MTLSIELEKDIESFIRETVLKRVFKKVTA